MFDFIYYIINKRGLHHMGRNNKTKDKKPNTSNKQNNPSTTNKTLNTDVVNSNFSDFSNKNEKIKKIILNNIGEIIIGILILIVWYYNYDLPNSINELKISNAEMKVELETLSGNYSVLNSQVWAINASMLTLNSKNNETELEPIILLNVKDSFSSNIAEQYLSDQTVFNSSGKFILENTQETIATKIDTQEDITQENLKNELFIITYQENGQDVFFYGKITKKLLGWKLHNKSL